MMRLIVTSTLLYMANTSLAQAPPWNLAAGSTLQFAATQQGAEFGGRFDSFAAEIQFEPAELASSHFLVTVAITSVNTDNGERDDALRSSDLFDASRWPEARFEAAEFRAVGDDRFEALGSLTIRDQTHPLVLPFNFTREGTRGTLRGEVTISRLDYGVGQGEWADTQWIGERVKVRYVLALVSPP
jgi:polyisoprenoid-binding protein YceI